MQPVSGNFDPYAAVRRVGAQVVFELIDVDAAEATSVITSAKQASVSNSAQLYDRILFMSKALATLEPNYWRLDGKFGIFDYANRGECGFWSSSLSNDSGSISSYIRFDFATGQSSDGFTIVFDDKTGECASDFKIQVYGPTLSKLMATKTITGNTEPVCWVDMPVQNYRRVRITFTKTSNPHRRIRVCEVVFGRVQVFGSDDIASLRVQRQTAPDMASLPAGALELTINNADGQYNINNPGGIYAYLQKGQGLTVYAGVDGELVSLGRYYFDNAESSDNSMTAKITAYDQVFALDGVYYNAGKTGTWTVSAAVAAIVAASGLAISYDIPAGLASRIVGQCIPRNTSCREALRLIAQAARCVCYFDTLDKLVFAEPVLSEVAQTYTTDHMGRWPKMADKGLINSVKLTVRNEYTDTETMYTAQNIDTGETEKLLEVDNPLATEQAVADWLLQLAGWRYTAEIDERGNPALELLDGVTAPDKFGNVLKGMVTDQTFSIMSSGMSGTTKLLAEKGGADA